MSDDSSMSVPMLYGLDILARRWHVPPWAFDTDDPEVSRWIARGLLFQQFEAQAAPKPKRKR